MRRRVEVGFTLQPDEGFLERCAPLFSRIDYAELAPETTWFASDGVLRPNGYHRRFLEIGDAHQLSFVAHGVGYSLGDPGGDERRARWRERIALDHAQFAFRWYSDHLCATAAGDEAVALPYALPRDAALRARIGERLDELAHVVPDVGVETTVVYFALDDPMGEPAWLNELVAPRARHVVLDLHNVWTMGQNLGFDPDAWLSKLDLARVIEIHVSGGADSDPAWLPSKATMRLDAHDSAVPEEVFELLARWAPRCPHLRGITLERMEGTVGCAHDVDGLGRELERVRDVAERCAPRDEVPRPETSSIEHPADDGHAAAIATALRTTDPTSALSALGLTSFPDDGVRIAGLLAARLRFERLMRGDEGLEAWFDRDPAGFSEAFRAYHREVPARAFFPPDEARLFARWMEDARSRG
ncbi:MAG: DUF692 family multinuclear iron-containing protein [Sandaracinaceae bacterium]